MLKSPSAVCMQKPPYAPMIAKKKPKRLSPSFLEVSVTACNFLHAFNAHLAAGLKDSPHFRRTLRIYRSQR